jgi:hypothetical protein
MNFKLCTCSLANISKQLIIWKSIATLICTLKSDFQGATRIFVIGFGLKKKCMVASTLIYLGLFTCIKPSFFSPFQPKKVTVCRTWDFSRVGKKSWFLKSWSRLNRRMSPTYFLQAFARKLSKLSLAQVGVQGRVKSALANCW